MGTDLLVFHRGIFWRWLVYTTGIFSRRPWQHFPFDIAAWMLLRHLAFFFDGVRIVLFDECWRVKNSGGAWRTCIQVSEFLSVNISIWLCRYIIGSCFGEPRLRSSISARELTDISRAAYNGAIKESINPGQCMKKDTPLYSSNTNGPILCLLSHPASCYKRPRRRLGWSSITIRYLFVLHRVRVLGPPICTWHSLKNPLHPRISDLPSPSTSNSALNPTLITSPKRYVHISSRNYHQFSYLICRSQSGNWRET